MDGSSFLASVFKAGLEVVGNSPELQGLAKVTLIETVGRLQGDLAEINGLPPDWKRLIQTLDRGSFDVARMLRTLKRLNYKGAVGLQCYAIPGDARDILTRSIGGWRKLCSRVDKEP